MNTRIRELEKQCWSHRVDGALVDGQLHFDTEKFAELIVKECADIAKHHVMNISTYADAEFVKKEIEKHFGVEE